MTSLKHALRATQRTWERGYWQVLAHRLDEGVGYVYLAHLENTPYYKIGCSSDPTRRMFDIDLSVLPVQVEGIPTIIHTIFTGDKYTSESALQRCYMHRHIAARDWFTLDLTEVAEICTLTDLTPYLVHEARAALSAYETRHCVDVRTGIRHWQGLPPRLDRFWQMKSDKAKDDLLEGFGL